MMPSAMAPMSPCRPDDPRELSQAAQAFWYIACQPKIHLVSKSPSSYLPRVYNILHHPFSHIQLSQSSNVLARHFFGPDRLYFRLWRGRHWVSIMHKEILICQVV